MGSAAKKTQDIGIYNSELGCVHLERVAGEVNIANCSFNRNTMNMIFLDSAGGCMKSKYDSSFSYPTSYERLSESAKSKLEKDSVYKQ